MNDHVHHWSSLNYYKVQCSGCQTVSSIQTLIDNEREDAARQERVKLLSNQLYNRELRKDAHTRYYQEVMKYVDVATLSPAVQEQETLL